MDVDLSALRRNLRLVRQLAGDREVIASIKANAYGFGVVEISRTLVAEGVRKLWTGNFDEAVELRNAGIDAEILLFGGVEPQHFATLLGHDLQPTIFEQVSATALGEVATATGRRAPAWVKVDSGLGRLGVPIDEALGFIRQVATNPALDLRGVYTHLPFGTLEGKSWALERYGEFQRLLSELAEAKIAVPYTQVWGTSGLLSGAPDASNAVCIGHALYGLSPLVRSVAQRTDLQPLIRSLSAAIVRADSRHRSRLAVGGYGDANSKKPVTAAIGLGDGLRKAVDGETAQVIVGGRRVPITAFTLEHLMIDATAVGRVELFDRATLIGGSENATITLDDWAHWTGSTPLEFMMSVSGKIPVNYGDLPIGA